MIETRDVRWGLFALIVAVGVAAGLAAAYGQSRREPTLYRAQTSLVIARGGQPVSGAGATGLVGTLGKLLKSPIVATHTIDNLHLRESPSALLRRVSVKQIGSSSILRLDFDDPSPARATQIAQALGLAFAQLVQNGFPTPSASRQPLAVAVWDPARVAPGKVSPRLRRDLAWGALLGLLAGLLVASLGARRRPERRSVAGLRVLGDGGTTDRVADALLELSAQRPFQTVALAGDPEGVVTASVAHALADRGALTIWVRAEDADATELDRLAARCAYVLVASPGFDPKLPVDAAIAVTSEANVGIADALLRQPGLRVLGTIAANGSWE